MLAYVGFLVSQTANLMMKPDAKELSIVKGIVNLLKDVGLWQLSF